MRLQHKWKHENKPIRPTALSPPGPRSDWFQIYLDLCSRVGSSESEYLQLSLEEFDRRANGSQTTPALEPLILLVLLADDRDTQLELWKDVFRCSVASAAPFGGAVAVMEEDPAKASTESPPDSDEADDGASVAVAVETETDKVETGGTADNGGSGVEVDGDGARGGAEEGDNEGDARADGATSESGDPNGGELGVSKTAPKKLEPTLGRADALGLMRALLRSLNELSFFPHEPSYDEVNTVLEAASGGADSLSESHWVNWCSYEVVLPHIYSLFRTFTNWIKHLSHICSRFRTFALSLSLLCVY